MRNNFNILLIELNSIFAQEIKSINMENILHLNGDVLFVPRIAIAIFFAILFIQSGLDKVMNFQENLSWLSTHFSSTFLSPTVPVVFVILTITEVAAGFLSAFGAIYIYFREINDVAYYGVLFSAISFLFLFFGQRIAKDYSGAQSLVAYFIVAILGLIILY
jgi:uncharacterized membrane protein YphA (DoxX/SURF4 family)